MIDRLKAHHSYDDTLIVVAGRPWRSGSAWQPDGAPIAPETVGDIAAIPLFVKRPSPANGRDR